MSKVASSVAASMPPVSYTHLDVYKRQEHPAAVGMGQPGFGFQRHAAAQGATIEAGALTAQLGIEELLVAAANHGFRTASEDRRERRIAAAVDTIAVLEPCLLYTSRCV